MLEFVIGTPGSGKTRYMMQKIAELAGQGRRAVLLTTRQATHAMERRLIRDHLPQGLLHVQVMDMDRLAQNILDEAGGGAGEHLSTLGRMMAVRAVSAGCKEDLHVYAQAFAQDGFCSRVSAQLEELWRWQVTPQELTVAAGQVSDPQLKQKLLDIARIHDACRQYFEDHDCAPVDMMQLAAQKAAQVSWIEQTTFFVDGLEMENAATRALIAGVLCRCETMYLTVCMDVSCAQQARFDVPRSVMRTYRDMADTLGVAVKEHHLQGERIVPDALLHLKQHLFVYPGRAYTQAADCITLASFRDPRHEARSVAAQIIARCKEENLRFRDFTVLCANGNEGYAQLRRAFEDYGIPAFYDVRRDLNGNTCAGLVVRIVEACMGAWRTQSLLPILKSGLTCFEYEQVCAAENYILEHGISGPARWKRPWRGKGAEDAEAVRAKAVQIFAPFFDAMQGNLSCRQRVEAIFEVLDCLQVCEKLEQIVLQLQREGFSQEAAVTSQVWKVICEVLGQIQHVLGQEKFSLSDFCAMMREGLLATQLGIIPTTLDQVMVSDPTRWNGEGARVLYLIGATDEALSPAQDDALLFDDSDVLALMQQAELTVSADPRLRASQFKLQLYRTLCAAQQSLVISRPKLDMAGQPTGEAQLVSHLRRLFPKCAQQVIQPALPVSAQDGFSHWARGMRRAADGFDMPLWLPAAGAWFDQHVHWKAKAQNVRQVLHREAEQRLSPVLAQKLFAPPVHMSVTQLESYARCPFAHFARYAMHAKVRQEFTEGARADTGSFVHEMMYQLGRDILKGNVDVHAFDEVACQAWTKAAFDAMDEESGYYASLGSSASGRAIQARLHDNVMHAAMNLVRSIAQSKFQIAAVEQEIPPVTLETEAGDVELVGRIDRVDVAHLDGMDAARVIDYKSSAKNTALSQIYYGQQLQLAAYLLAVCENAPLFDSSDLVPGGMLYFPIGDKNTLQADESRMHGIVNMDEQIVQAMDTQPTQSGKSQIVAPISRGTRSGRLTAGQMELVLRFTKDEMSRLAGGAAQGDARACPSWTTSAQTRACAYCDYAGACAFDVRKRPLDVNRMPNMQDDAVLKQMTQEEGEDEQNP